jgi:plastocyanin
MRGLPLLLLLAACGDSGGGSGTDAPAVDAPAVDRLAVDQLPSDGPRTDGRTPDGLPIDAASANACASSYAGCSTYTDLSAPSADRTVTFTFAQYTPKCIKIKAGQSVTFSGDFSSHPLRQACGTAGVIPNTDSGTTATVTFNTADTYGYYCLVHGSADGTGMAGSVQVVP